MLRRFSLALALLAALWLPHEAWGQANYYTGRSSGVLLSGSFTNGNCVKNIGTGTIPTLADSGGACGGSGSPGGSANSLQYNNAGSFGGITNGTNGQLLLGVTGSPAAFGTMSGDGTITNAGVLSITGGSHLTGTLGSGLTAPSLTVTTAFTATGLVTNADLANPATTVNGQTCTLGASCTTTVAISTGVTGLGANIATALGLALNGTGAISATTSPAFVNPVVGTQAATDNSTLGASTAYVTTAINNAIAAVNPAVAVVAATTVAGDTSTYVYANGVSGIGATLTGPTNNVAVTFDGVTLTTVGQRVLVKNDTQSPSGAFNGVYSLTILQGAANKPVLTRALDFDQSSDINSTGAIPVTSGTVNATTSWVVTSSVTTVGTDPITFTKFSIAPSTIQTTALTNTHLWVGNGSNLAVDVALSGDCTMANTGAITCTKMNNVSVSLGGTLTTANAFTTSGAFATTLTSTATTNSTLPAGTHTLAALDVNQAWTAGQAVTPDTATSCGTQSSGGTATPNFANSNSCQLTFGAGNFTLAAPTGVKIGQFVLITLKQDGTGSRTLTGGFPSAFDFGTAGAPTLTTTASKTDIISCYAVAASGASSLLCTANLGF